MKEKATNSFNNNDMVKTKEWIDACETFNKAKVGHLINFDRIKLDYLKKNKATTDLTGDELTFHLDEIKMCQLRIYATMKTEPNSEQMLKDFMQEQGLTDDDLIDPTPIKLFGQNLRINESVEEPKMIHQGTEIQSTVREIKIEADWIDQGWGNKKARLFLRLYRQNNLIFDQDLFGICQRNDPNQK